MSREEARSGLDCAEKIQHFLGGDREIETESEFVSISISRRHRRMRVIETIDSSQAEFLAEQIVVETVNNLFIIHG